MWNLFLLFTYFTASTTSQPLTHLKEEQLTVQVLTLTFSVWAIRFVLFDLEFGDFSLSRDIWTHKTP